MRVQDSGNFFRRNKRQLVTTLMVIALFIGVLAAVSTLVILLGFAPSSSISQDATAFIVIAVLAFAFPKLIARRRQPPGING